ncbi:MAG: CysS/YqeB C-terminal domain-containing protein, partial [Hasllibacter sp.]
PSPDRQVIGALADDMNTAAALARMHEIVSEGGTVGAEAALLGVSLSQQGADLSPLVDGLLTARKDARAARDFARADAIRDGLIAAGIEVRDGPEGTDWSPGPSVDRAALEALL